jgi:putative ABC transport system permease protein
MIWPTVRREVSGVDPQIALYNVTTMPEALAHSVAQQRFTMLLLGIFAGAAMLLALIGVHGVLSYTVAQRRHEMGIRMALGASRGAVARLVIGRGALLALAGIALGIAGAAAGSRLLAGLLFGVTAVDPATYVVVALAVAVVALVATLLPARRAMIIDPRFALRLFCARRRPAPVNGGGGRRRTPAAYRLPSAACARGPAGRCSCR